MMFALASRVSSVPGGNKLLALWMVALICLIVFPMASAFEGEALGGLAFSMLPAAILINIAIPIAHDIRVPQATQIVRGSWVVLCAIELVLVLAAFDGAPNSDIDVVLLISMTILSFPSGLGVLALFAAISLASGMKTTYFTLGITWLGFFSSGYLQWFIYLPRRKWLRRSE